MNLLDELIGVTPKARENTQKALDKYELDFIMLYKFTYPKHDDPMKYLETVDGRTLAKEVRAIKAQIQAELDLYDTKNNEDDEK